MHKFKFSIIAMVLMLQAASIFACGQCVQDKMAAVYDYEVIKHAIEKKQIVIFLGYEGNIVPDLESRLKMMKLIAKINGIDVKSIQISMENASFSFAFDPERISYLTLIKVLGRTLAKLNLSVFAIDSIKSL